jgi:SAM-dependent methyltransferase
MMFLMSPMSPMMPQDPDNALRAGLLQAYAALARTYDANRGLFDMSEVLREAFSRLSPTPGRLIDLGCGAGEPVPAAFLERGWEVIGVDFCPEMLALAAHHVPRMQRVQADMRAVDFPAASADAVTAIYSLFHLPATTHADLFARVHRWLRPGGRFLFTYAGRDYTGAESFDGYKTFMGQRLYYSHRDPATLTRQLRGAGLAPEAMTPREIGGERFLWVIAERPSPAGAAKLD